jgi:hypothetical protein
VVRKARFGFVTGEEVGSGCMYRRVLWATKKVTFFENWLLFLIGQYFMYVLGNEK